VKRRISSLLAVLIAGAAAQGADREARDWPLNGRSFDAAYFSPLRQIDASNVATLGLAWEFDGFVVRGRTHRGNEASPLVADGVMYFSGPWSVVYALDARSGQLLWKYDPEVSGQWARNVCCDVVNRGVALWQGRVYVATGKSVDVFAPDGKFVGSIPGPQGLHGTFFGGRDKKTLFGIVFYGGWGTPSARNLIIAIPAIAQGYTGRAK